MSRLPVKFRPYCNVYSSRLAPAPQTIKTIDYAMYFWLFWLANFGIVQENTSQGPKLMNSTILISKYRLTHNGNIWRTNVNQEEDRGTQKDRQKVLFEKPGKKKKKDGTRWGNLKVHSLQREKCNMHKLPTLGCISRAKYIWNIKFVLLLYHQICNMIVAKKGQMRYQYLFVQWKTHPPATPTHTAHHHYGANAQQLSLQPDTQSRNRHQTVQSCLCLHQQ